MTAFVMMNPEIVGLCVLAVLVGVIAGKCRDAFAFRDFELYQLLLGSLIASAVVGCVVFARFVEAPLLLYASNITVGR